MLLVHWGEPDKRRLPLIDGGPNTVYANVLEPGPEELAAGQQGPLTLGLMM